MELTKVSKDGNSRRTTVPAKIFKQLGIADGDYIVWTWTTKGHIEIRPLPKAHELVKLHAKK